MFKILTSQVNVLRQIAMERPRAHLAFLAHEAYRKLYGNAGQDGQLADYWGTWQIIDLNPLIFCIHHKLAHNNMSFHPLYSQIDCYKTCEEHIVLYETRAPLINVKESRDFNFIYFTIYPLHRKQIQNQYIFDGNWSTYNMIAPPNKRKNNTQSDEFLQYVRSMYKKLTNKEFIAYFLPHNCGRLKMIAANVV